MELRIHHRTNPLSRQTAYRVKSYSKFYRGDNLLDGLTHVGHAAMLDTVNVVLNKLREVEPRRSTYTVLIETN